MANLIRRRNEGVTQQRPQQEYSFDPFRMMDALLRWDPFRGGLSQEGGWLGRTAEFLPTFDIKETKDAYVIQADLPGVKEEDVEVSLNGNVMTISGKREQEQREEGDQDYAVERSYGTFARSFSLPEGANVDDIKADLKNGVLTLHAPKRPEVQPKRISIGRSGQDTGRPKA